MSEFVDLGQVRAMTDVDELREARDKYLVNIEMIVAQLEFRGEETDSWEARAIKSLAINRAALRIVERKLEPQDGIVRDLMSKIERLERDLKHSRQAVQLETQRLSNEKYALKQASVMSQERMFKDLCRERLPRSLFIELYTEADRLASLGKVAAE